MSDRRIPPPSTLLTDDSFEWRKFKLTVADAIDIIGKDAIDIIGKYVKLFERSTAAQKLDKSATLTDLEHLRNLAPNWNGYYATPIDRRVIRAAEEFILNLNLPGTVTTTPKVVPMTKGRLQFEWHRGNRSLELEFENVNTLHFLKWDSDAGIEEEDVISVNDTDQINALFRWFSSE